MVDSAINIIKKHFDGLPKPIPNDLGNALGIHLAGDEVPLKLFNDYMAAYKVIEGMVKNGTAMVDGSAIALVRDAVIDFVGEAKAKNPNGLELMIDTTQKDNSFVVPSTNDLSTLAGNLVLIFNTMEYAPPQRARKL
jgi:hypothetical protein